MKLFKKTVVPQVHPLAWHLFKACESGRELIQGPVVPDGEIWVLTSMHAKNNTGSTQEINVAVYDGHEWMCLGSRARVWQYDGVAWSGSVDMGPGWQLGTCSGTQRSGTFFRATPPTMWRTT